MSNMLDESTSPFVKIQNPGNRSTQLLRNFNMLILKKKKKTCELGRFRGEPNNGGSLQSKREDRTHGRLTEFLLKQFHVFD